MEISLIILTYNSSRFIKNLLEGLIDKYKEKIKDGKLEIILADNASTDDTLKKASQFKDSAKIIENGRNFGFAKGNNMAARKASGKVLLFINPDAEFTRGDLFDLIKEFENEKVGIVGGEILDFEGKKEYSAGKAYTLLRIFLLSLGLEEKTGARFSPEKRKEVDLVTGAFLAIKRDLFEKLDGFDEHYFMYVEDADLCFRAKNLGYEVLFSPSATIKHMGQGSSSRKFAVVNIYKGLLYFHKKHMGKISYNLVKALLMGKAASLVFMGKVSNNKSLVEIYTEALKV